MKRNAHARRKRLVRCVECGSRQDPLDDGCASCRRPFWELCTCGASRNVFDSGACLACGVEQDRPAPPRVPTAFKRRAKIAAAVVLALACAWLAAAPRPTPAWRLKAEARDLVARRTFDVAARRCHEATVQNPGDAEAWTMLAVCLRALDFDADAQRAAAVNAVKIDPGRADALCFLAEVEMSRGRLDAAVEYACRAAQVPLPPARAHELIGEIEMRRPRPDWTRVISSLERARAEGAVDARTTLQLAQARLAVYGDVAPEALPADARALLREAESALSSVKERSGDDAPVAMLRARLALSLGRADEAAAAADCVLALVEADADARAQALVVRGRARLALGDRSAAARDFGDALRLAPDASAASDVSAALSGPDDFGTAEAVLRAAAAVGDPGGGIRAVLACRLLSARRLDDAASAAAAARAAAPAEARYALIDGDVQAARGRRDAAAAAYADASRLAPDLVAARLRTAVLALDAPGGGAARAQAVRDAADAVAALAKDAPGDADAFDTLGILRTALGDASGARDAFERAVALRPVDPELWVRFARACRRVGDPDAVERAESAFRRARALRPSDRTLVVEEARMRIDAGDYAGAVDVCGAYLSARPDDAAALRLRAEAERRLARWDAAVADLEASRRLGAAGRDDDALLALVDTQFRAGRDRVARALIAAADARGSESLRRSLDRLGRLHTGDVDSVLAEIAANGPQSGLAEILLATGRIDDALGTARAVLAASPGEPMATRVLVLALLTPTPRSEDPLAEAGLAVDALSDGAPSGLREHLSGRLKLARGDVKGAVTDLRVAAAAMRDDPLVVLGLGEALFVSGERAESLAALRRAAFMPGARPMARSILSDRLVEASRAERSPEAALRLVTEAARAAPSNAAAVLETARLLSARGDHAASADVAERALSTPGLSADAEGALRRRAIVSRLFAGDLERVRSLNAGLDPAVRAGTFGLVVCGFASLHERDWDGAATALAAARTRDPANPLPVVGLVRAAAGRKDVDAARRALDAWRAERPDDRDVEAEAARTLDGAGLHDAALEVAFATARAHPAEWTPTARLVEMLGRRGRAAEALEAARRLASAAPPEQRPDAHLLVGEAALRFGSDADAALAASREVQREPVVAEPTLLRARLLEAEALAARGDDAEAAAVAAAVVAAGPDRDVERRARFVVGVAALRIGRPGEAAKLFARCLEIDPNDRQAMNNLAWALGRSPTGRAKAREIAARLTELDRSDANAWDTRADVAAADGDAADAETSWRRALEIYDASPPRDVDVRHGVALRLAELLDKGGRADDARSLAAAVLGGARNPELKQRAKHLLDG